MNPDGPERLTDQRLEEVLAEYFIRVDRGETVDRDEFIRQNLDVADQLRSYFTAADSVNACLAAGSAGAAEGQAESPHALPVKDQGGGSGADVAAGQLIGRYRVVRCIGGGGFGQVYLCRDEMLRRDVAVKVPHRHLLPDKEDVDLYIAEAQVVASLDHPNIVPVYDAGRSGDGLCFVVSKYIDGHNLADHANREVTSHVEAAEVVATVAEALHYAHLRGLVHRDIKPGNILLDTSRVPHVVDFGLAVKEDDLASGHGLAGTPPYMSPEQVRVEGHRVDGRSDIFSLGAVFYELLTKRRAFSGSDLLEIFAQVTMLDPRPPRQRDDTIPKELERICLKSLSKKASDRYTTAKDMADDLRHFLGESSRRPVSIAHVPDPGANACVVRPVPVKPPAVEQGDQSVRIVPKGLRSFDAHDADFFLELLPGPRDRTGLPDSVRFWKNRIEEADRQATFPVGLIYGPSGCGKSSFVKAGLLPHLDIHVVSAYVEATVRETESRLLAALRKRCAELRLGLGLRESIAAIRRGQVLPPGKKILIILDQFEQWLHGNRDAVDTELVDALRQCDGERVQCVITVRDDFWLATSRLFKALEIRLIDGHNSALFDLFDPLHARHVLAQFGRAYGRLPDKLCELTEDQSQFLSQSVKSLTQEGKVICVRLAVFADMLKGRPWTTDTLAEVGGAEGLGYIFFEETFSASTAPAEHRQHQRAARDVLRTLLPESGTDIKGGMRSYEDLLHASAYARRPGDFEDVIRVLDTELRLITPTDPVGFAEEEGRNEEDRDLRATVAAGAAPRAERAPSRPPDPRRLYYQLTHDYLVPSLREWLTRKQRATWKGRAELRLEERSSMWNARSEPRHLPAWWEYLDIRMFSRRAKWTEPQRRMMSAASRYYGFRVCCGAALVLMAAFLVQRFLAGQTHEVVRGKLAALQSTMGQGVPPALQDLERFPRSIVLDELQRCLREDAGQHRLPLHYARARFEQVDYRFLVKAIGTSRNEECDNIVAALAHAPGPAIKELRGAAASAASSQNWQLKTRLATVALHLGDTSIAADMLRTKPPATGQSPTAPPNWIDDPLDPAATIVDAKTKAAIEAAHGLIGDRFAFCQDMPWETCLAVIQSLRPCGYRPTRVRPFARGDQRLVAAVWTRDRRKWRLDVDRTADQLPPSDAPAVDDGLLPADVAGYQATSGGLLYTLLWCADGAENEQRRVAVGMTEPQLLTVSATMSQSTFAMQKSIQVTLANDGARRYAGIWSDQQCRCDVDRHAIEIETGDLLPADIGLAPLGKPTSPLDLYRQQMAIVASWPAQVENAANVRQFRALAYYYLDQPEQCLKEIDSLVQQKAARFQDLQLRALSLGMLGRREDAATAFREFEKAAGAIGSENGYVRCVGIILSAWLGDMAQAREQLDTLQAASPVDSQLLYNCACAAAQLARASTRQGPDSAAQWEARSIELLGSAIRHGYCDLSCLLTDADLAPLFGRAEFAALLTDLAPSGSYSVVSHTDLQYDHQIVADSSVETQREQSRRLAGEGLRPVSIAVNAAADKAELRSASVWRRPVPPEAKWDPIQRTMFIEHLPRWFGDWRKLADVIRGTEDPALRSGISLALGSIEQPGVEGKAAWQPLLSEWFRGQPDSGTHGAAGWALRKWELKVPDVPPASAKRAGLDWQRTKTEMTLVRIPAGEIRAADVEGRKRVIRIVRDFWLSDREVTRETFRRFLMAEDAQLTDNSEMLRRSNAGDPSLPAFGVSWHDAVIFCNWLSRQEGYDPCYRKAAKNSGAKDETLQRDIWEFTPGANGYRLPTENEWEYACRAGATTIYSFGDPEVFLDRYGLCNKESRPGPERGGSRLCNAWGLFDMHGNLSEWCQDSAAVESHRIVRGGSWSSPGTGCEAAYRDSQQATSHFNSVGFRVALGGAGKELSQGVNPAVRSN